MNHIVPCLPRLIWRCTDINKLISLGETECLVKWPVFNTSCLSEVFYHLMRCGDHSSTYHFCKSLMFGCTIKDSDESQPAQADVIDTRGQKASVVSHWCIKYTPSSKLWLWQYQDIFPLSVRTKRSEADKMWKILGKSTLKNDKA